MVSISNAHSILINDTLILLGKEARDICRIWKNHTGQAYTLDSVKYAMGLIAKGSSPRDVMGLLRTMKFGLPGSADIMGLHKKAGSVWLEGKTGSGRQSKQQKNFESMVLDFGGHYCLFREPVEALEFMRGL